MSDENDPGHGHSPAAWVAVVVMLIGFTAGTFAFWFDQALLVWISAGVDARASRRRSGSTRTPAGT
jgi:hypothetical protein